MNDPKGQLLKLQNSMPELMNALQTTEKIAPIPTFDQEKIETSSQKPQVYCNDAGNPLIEQPSTGKLKLPSIKTLTSDELSDEYLESILTQYAEYSKLKRAEKGIIKEVRDALISKNPTKENLTLLVGSVLVEKLDHAAALNPTNQHLQEMILSLKWNLYRQIEPEIYALTVMIEKSTRSRDIATFEAVTTIDKLLQDEEILDTQSLSRAIRWAIVQQLKNREPFGPISAFVEAACGLFNLEKRLASFFSQIPNYEMDVNSLKQTKEIEERTLKELSTTLKITPDEAVALQTKLVVQPLIPLWMSSPYGKSLLPFVTIVIYLAIALMQMAMPVFIFSFKILSVFIKLINEAKNPNTILSTIKQTINSLVQTLEYPVLYPQLFLVTSIFLLVYEKICTSKGSNIPSVCGAQIPLQKAPQREHATDEWEDLSIEQMRMEWMEEMAHLISVIHSFADQHLNKEEPPHETVDHELLKKLHDHFSVQAQIPIVQSVVNDFSLEGWMQIPFTAWFENDKRK